MWVWLLWKTKKTLHTRHAIACTVGPHTLEDAFIVFSLFDR